MRMLKEYNENRTVLNRKRKEQHGSMINPESEVGLRLSTAPVTALASSHSEPIDSAAAKNSSYQQQASPTMFPKNPTPEEQATTGIN